MVGTTRSRISFFMNKFRRLGFIDYNGSPDGQTVPDERGPTRLSCRVRDRGQDIEN